MTTTLPPATLEAIERATGRPILNRGTEVRADCPLCGKGSRTSTKLRVTLGRSGLFAHCYSCNAPSRTILRAFGIEGASERGPLPAAYRPPEPDPVVRAEPLPPLSPAAVQVYMAAIARPGRTGRIEYGSTDGRRGTHERTALPPSSPGGKPGKDIRMWGLRGHGWYPRKWLPEGGPTTGQPRFLTEGEKDAGVIAQLGYEAYSAPGGAGRFRSLALGPVIADSLGDGAPLYIIQDNDVAGYRWGQAVHDALVEQGVRVIHPSPVQEAIGDSLADNPERLKGIVEGSLPHFATVLEAYFLLGFNTAKCGNGQGKLEIPRPEITAEKRCRSGYGRRGTAAADVNSGVYRTLTMPVDCRKCNACLECRLDEIWALWAAAEPQDGAQTRVAFLDLASVDMVGEALTAQRRRIGCKREPAFRATVRREVEAVDEDSEPEYRYDVLIWYRDGLSGEGVDNTRAWAVERSIRCEIERDLTVYRGDFGAVLAERSIRGEDGKRKNTTGFWQWPVKFAPPSPPVYTLGRDAHRVHVPGERGSIEPDGSEAALKRLEIERRDPELGAALNARDWMQRVSISVAQWDKLVQDVQEGLRPPMLPGYKGPPGLLRDAVWAWLYVKPVRTAHLEVYARIGAEQVAVKSEPLRPPLTEIALGLKRLQRRMDASELAGGAVSLIEPPASDEIGAEDYDTWDDFDVPLPDWDDDWEPDWEPL